MAFPIGPSLAAWWRCDDGCRFFADLRWLRHSYGHVRFPSGLQKMKEWNTDTGCYHAEVPSETSTKNSCFSAAAKAKEAPYFAFPDLRRCRDLIVTGAYDYAEASQFAVVFAAATRQVSHPRMRAIYRPWPLNDRRRVGFKPSRSTPRRTQFALPVPAFVIPESVQAQLKRFKK